MCIRGADGEVAGAVAARGPEGALPAATLQRLADARRGEVLPSHHRCELLTLWGEKPEGRLVQRDEARLEYAPDLRGRIR